MSSRDRSAVRWLPQMTRLALRADPSMLEDLERAWGAPIPRGLMTSHVQGPQAALCLGPDEWSLQDTAASGADIIARFTGRHDLPPHALVDVSDRSLAVEISDVDGEDLLAKACPLDLSLEAFAPGRCTRTVFGKCEVVLWRRPHDHMWRLEFWRSFAPYVAGLLAA